MPNAQVKGNESNWVQWELQLVKTFLGRDSVRETAHPPNAQAGMDPRSGLHREQPKVNLQSLPFGDEVTSHVDGHCQATAFLEGQSVTREEC